MAIDVDTEDLIPFQQAAAHIPGRPCLQTLHRWRQKPGVRGVVLETILVGGIRYTSREAIRRFIAAQNISQQPAPAMTRARRDRQARAAMAALAAK
jgi:hypothetical protein